MNSPTSSDEDLFQRAATIHSLTEREAYLDAACANDSARRQRIHKLFAARAPTEGSTPSGTPLPAGVSTDTTTIPGPGDKIGRYRLLQEIGKGGCGVVYLAEQEEPVRREVALKVIKLGMDTRNVVARFEAERQALAMMDHPNIARVFDAGATETGRPYFVMELVRGVSITRFCDDHRISMPGRIEMFIKVCQAIQHAHQKGIIHRDIKPSNILVAMLDGAPVPKVIDFGIAKAIDEASQSATALTTHQGFIGTPAYASPEQIESGGTDVDTRSDVYSLGVVLYELLTGCKPFDLERMREGGLFYMYRVICEVDPPRPSTRLKAVEPSARQEIADQRRISGNRLAPLMRGDLDWIVMKCLEKKRPRRYETANGLAADLRRYLQHEPVVARPPSTAYGLQKLMHRHRLAFAAGGVVAVTLVAGFTVSTNLYFRERAALNEQALLQKEAQISAAQARTEAEKSRQVSAYMKEMIAGVGPVAMASESSAWRQIVDRASARLGREKLNPVVEWELRTTLAEVYSSLGQRLQAADMHADALKLARRHAELSPFQVIDSLVNVAWNLKEANQAPAADPLLQEALALGLKAHPPGHPKVTWIKGRMGWNMMALRRIDEAEALCREALEQAREYWKRPDATRDELPASVSSFATALAFVMQLRNNSVEAEKLFREALESARSEKGDNHPDIRSWMHNLAAFLDNEGRRDEAEALYRRGWEIARTSSPNHPGQIAGAASLLLLLRERQADEEADQIISRLMAAARNQVEADRPSWANNLSNVGLVAAAHRHWADAFQMLRMAADLGSQNPRLPAGLLAVASMRQDSAALQSAAALYRANLSGTNRPPTAPELLLGLALAPRLGIDKSTLEKLAGNAAKLPENSGSLKTAARALAQYRLAKTPVDTAFLSAIRLELSTAKPGSPNPKWLELIALQSFLNEVDTTATGK
jgi:tetratricopeptide (TPR) repeat protein